MDQVEALTIRRWIIATYCRDQLHSHKVGLFLRVEPQLLLTVEIDAGGTENWDTIIFSAGRYNVSIALTLDIIGMSARIGRQVDQLMLRHHMDQGLVVL